VIALFGRARPGGGGFVRIGATLCGLESIHPRGTMQAPE